MEAHMTARLLQNTDEFNSDYIATSNTMIITNSQDKNILYNKRFCGVVFTTSKLKINELDDAHRTLLEIDSNDLIGGSIVQTKSNNFQLLLYYYPIYTTRCCGLLTDLQLVSNNTSDSGDSSCPKDDRCRVRQELVLDFLTNRSLCEHWLNAVRCLVFGQLPQFCEGICPQQPLYLVVVNPVGGQGYGRSIWTNTVSKMLHEADIKVDLAINADANEEVLRHVRALLFDSQVHDEWPFEQLPLAQRIMNTVETTSTGVTPADSILSHSIRLTSHIMSPVSSTGKVSDPESLLLYVGFDTPG